MKTRTKVIFGYILIILGIGLPLLAFTSMTWRNLTAKGDYRDFKEAYREVDESSLQAYSSDLKAYNENIKNQEKMAVIDPFTANDYQGTYDIEYLTEDGVFAYLLIPKLDMTKPVYLDASYDHLDKGVAQIDGTNLPVGGQSTRSVIAGHRGWWGDTMFLHIDNLEPGDQIYIDRGDEILEYEVRDKEVIGDSDWHKLQAKEGEDMVTLLTCHPFSPPRPYRLLINAYRVGVEEVQEGEINQSTAEKLVNHIENSPTDPQTAMMNKVIYGVTIIGWLGLIIVLIRMVRYLNN